MPETAIRPLFAAYAPTPLNDDAIPPFPGHEADEEDESAAANIDTSFEVAEAAWQGIAPDNAPDDAPVRFIDGSIRSRTVGCIVVDGRRRPLIAAVISAAALDQSGRRVNRGAGTVTKKVLAVHNNGIDEEHIRDAFHALDGIGVRLETAPTELQRPDFDAMRRTTRGLVMTVMEHAERDVMLEGLPMPTLMDGLLERRLATQQLDWPVVGLVKRQMATYLPSSLQEVVYALRPGERTPAFVMDTLQHVELVNFYMRLSGQRDVSPSNGIVRVTVPLAYVRRAHAHDMQAYLSGLAGHLFALRCRDQGYSRSGISIDPIVRCEDHLHAIRPNMDALIPKLHRMFRAERFCAMAKKRADVKPYVLADGEGRSYTWHDVLFTIKAAAAETGGAFSLWDVTTRPGEEPHVHVHDDVDEIFYVLSGTITFHVGEESYKLLKHGFAYVPLGTLHTYTIHTKEVRMLGISTPSDFGDHIETTGKRVGSSTKGHEGRE